MSGTSLDGIDVAFVEVGGTGPDLIWKLRGFHSTPYADPLREQLLRASAGEMGLRETFALDADLGGIYAQAIREGATRESIDLSQIAAVGLHGQTVYHAPQQRPHGVTVQLGSAAVVASDLRTVVVNNFRANDVAAGGEGAPLVPYCDYAMLRNPERNRVALNIGGIANITWLPRDVRPDSLIAFDTGPGNALIDAAMRRLRGAHYDASGEYAASGTPDESWLNGELLAHPYFQGAPPKSTGRELFGEGVGIRLADEGAMRGMRGEDIVATLTLMTARSIARGIREFAAKDCPIDELIVGGGGAHNLTLMDMLRRELPGTEVIPGDTVGVPGDAKEAICFAILANEALCETPAGVPSVTGASRPVICGAITLP
jgi:anhydro-N-acetylmuramic acid kinase